MHQNICRDFLQDKHKKEIFENEKIANDLKESNEKIVNDLKESNEKIVNDLKQQIEKLQNTIQNLAKEAINRPTVTTNTNTINIRNKLSSQYTMDKIETEDLTIFFNENLTEKVFMSGQKALAKLCTEKILKSLFVVLILAVKDSSKEILQRTLRICQ